MIDPHINNPISPKYHVRKYLESIRHELRNKIVLDVLPAGNGATTEILQELGARVEPFDLFPEYFMLLGAKCRRANMLEGIPVGDNYADLVICQEGMEHFISLRTLLGRHTFMLLKKARQLSDLDFGRDKAIKPFGQIM